MVTLLEKLRLDAAVFTVAQLTAKVRAVLLAHELEHELARPRVRGAGSR
jgi:hypothetical protein